MEIAAATEVEATPTQSKPTELITHREEKYLTFILGEEEYGIEILKVREIIGVIEIVALPNAPSYIKGVVNLRGSVIPVVDLRLKFNMPEKEYNKETCIIVVNMLYRHIGIIVDTVSEVLDIQEDDIDDPPSFGASIEANFIHGMGKVGDRVKILLDIDNVLNFDIIPQLNQVDTQIQTEEDNNAQQP
jgi:purine-binding chemotaxis protein CheW